MPSSARSRCSRSSPVTAATHDGGTSAASPPLPTGCRPASADAPLLLLPPLEDLLRAAAAAAAWRANMGTSQTRISASSKGGFCWWMRYWRLLRSQALPCRLNAATTALHAFTFQICAHTQFVLLSSAKPHLCKDQQQSVQLFKVRPLKAAILGNGWLYAWHASYGANQGNRWAPAFSALLPSRSTLANRLSAVGRPGCSPRSTRPFGSTWGQRSEPLILHLTHTSIPLGVTSQCSVGHF